MTLNRVNIIKNVVELKEGGGILFDYCKDINILNTNIFENIAHFGGGSKIINSERILFNNTEISNNTGMEKGPGIYI